MMTHSYSSPPIRVRYTDTTEADIGFDDDVTTAEAPVLPPGVHVWYDQSGRLQG